MDFAAYLNTFASIHFIARMIFRNALFLSLLTIAQLAFSQNPGMLYLTSRDSSSSVRINVGFQLSTVHRSFNNSTYLNLDRARLQFRGQAFDPRLSYFFQVALENSQRTLSDLDANKALLDGWLMYKLTSWLNVKAGLFLLPAARQDQTPIFFIQFTDRSLSSRTFTFGRDYGIELIGEFNIGPFIFHPILAVDAGEGRSVAPSIKNEGSQYVMRLEMLTGGKFKNGRGISEGDLDREGHPKGSIGVSFVYNDDAIRTRGNSGPFIDFLPNVPGTSDIKSLVIDAMWKYRGASLFFEYINQDADNPLFTSGEAWTGQASYLFGSNWELAFRNGRVNIEGSDFTQKETKFAITKYIHYHRFKILGEFGRLNLSSENSSSIFKIQLTALI